MRWIDNKLTFLLLVVASLLIVTACNPSHYEETESKIITVESLSRMMSDDKDLVIVDMQSVDDYAKGHVSGAVNIVRDDIVVNVPVDNMLTSKSRFERLMGEKGIGNDATVVIYDGDRMSAARLWWSFLVYGKEDVYVVDGGIAAIKDAGIELTDKSPAVKETTYTATDKNKAYIADMSEVLREVDEPEQNTELLDVRSDEEFTESGKIPSSVMYDFNNVFYKDGTYKDVQTIRINFMDIDMRPEKQIIMYCQTSMRASPVFLSLYNAGYRNIKIYDGAYLEWSSYPNNPIEAGGGATIMPDKKDAS